MVAYGFKKQFIEPILAGLGEPVDVRPKSQTIRAVGKRRHARPGETVQLYTAMRTKQCRKLGDARCVSVEPIRIFMSGFIDLAGVNVSGARLREFAQADGFADWPAMKEFWLANHGCEPFEGILIKWEPMA